MTVTFFTKICSDGGVDAAGAGQVYLGALSSTPLWYMEKVSAEFESSSLEASPQDQGVSSPCC